MILLYVRTLRVPSSFPSSMTSITRIRKRNVWYRRKLRLSKEVFCYNGMDTYTCAWTQKHAYPHVFNQLYIYIYISFCYVPWTWEMNVLVNNVDSDLVCQVKTYVFFPSPTFRENMKPLFAKVHTIYKGSGIPVLQVHLKCCGRKPKGGCYETWVGGQS